jgi:NitT/TauT family transport system permease protein
MSVPSPAPSDARTFRALQEAARPALTDEEALAEQARLKRRRRRIKVQAGRVALLLAILGLWQGLTAINVIDPIFYGQPTGIALRLVDFARNGTAYGSLWEQIWVTMDEAVQGFAFGVVFGIVFGITLGQIPILADIVGPFIKVLNAIPRIVLGAIFVVSLGLGTTSKVALAAVLVFFVVFFNAFQGVREVDQRLIDNCRVLGASTWQIVRNVVIPSALTWIIASLHVAFGFAVIGAIVGEFLGATRGLGLVIATAQNQFDPNGVFAMMLVIGLIALTAEWLIELLEHRVLGWRPPTRSQTASL